MSASKWAVVGLIARLVVGGVLITAGASKLSSPPEEFAVVIENYEIVSTDAAEVLAAFMPWCELFLGFALVFGFMTPYASVLSGAMLVGFLGALLSAAARGIELYNCGCFGGRFHPKPAFTMVMDAVLLAAVAAAFRHGSALWSLDKWADARYTAARKP